MLKLIQIVGQNKFWEPRLNFGSETMYLSGSWTMVHGVIQRTWLFVHCWYCYPPPMGWVQTYSNRHMWAVYRLIRSNISRFNRQQREEGCGVIHFSYFEISNPLFNTIWHQHPKKQKKMCATSNFFYETSHFCFGLMF